LHRKHGDDADIAALDGLRDALKDLSIDQSTRYRLLLEELRRIGWNGTATSPRVLLFTESTVTQAALVKALAKRFGLSWSAKHEDQPGQVMAAIHGGIADIWLGKTIEAFGTGTAPLRMLIATDVASEGVNLHHQCWHVIHYDLPWSIITLIQRNGRIDRFGQQHAPEIRYLMVHTEVGELKGDHAFSAASSRRSKRSTERPAAARAC
jgi:superfamily II DNA/RNA helicase